MLRNYQVNLIEEVRASFKAGNRAVVMQLPTGGGKTACFTYIAKSASDKNSNVLILTHRAELLEQAGGQFERIGLHYENLTADVKHIPTSNVVVGMVETIARRDKNWLSRFNLIIVDECHLQNFDKIYSHIPKNCLVLGATATPFRQGNTKPLSEYFGALIEGINVNCLINEGFLSKPEYYGIPADLSSVPKTRGEFDVKALDRVFSSAKTYSGLMANYDRLIKGRKSLIFCPLINSAMVLYSQLENIVKNSLYLITGDMPKTERNEILNKFYHEKSAILINVGVLTAGYDCPSIDTIVLYRATTSLPLYMQMCGRGSRVTDDKKTFRILDFGDNIRRFGFWHSDRVWSLDKPKKKQGVAPVKECPKCNALINASAKTCEYCGYIYPIKKNEEKKVQLVRIDENDPIMQVEAERLKNGYKTNWVLYRIKTLEDLKKYESFRGFKRGWAEINFKFKK